MHQLLSWPFDAKSIMQKKRRIKRELKEQGAFLPVRIALLGGATTSIIKDILELFLLDGGLEPTFYESEYNKWYESAIFPSEDLIAFRPHLVLIHTSIRNISGFPLLSDTPEQVEEAVSAETQKFAEVWRALYDKYAPIIIQDNFCLPDERVIGNLSFTHPNGIVRFVNRLNDCLLEAAAQSQTVFLHDVCYLSAKVGLRNWVDQDAYFLYKMVVSFDAVPIYCYSLAHMILAVYGKSKKCLVLDLDNTLWSGEIGEDGVNGIQLGHETPVGEAFLAFQQYVLRLKEKGIILAVCSKNEEAAAKKGFTHPDSLLKTSDFSSFIANWEPKHINLLQIANEVNISVDSLVFLDDNPAEREIVRRNLPEVTVPEVVSGDPMSYIRALEDGMYFDTLIISQDDLKRNNNYQANRQRNLLKKQFSSYEDFLRNLEMKVEITPFSQIYLDRIAQLTNKTNQFNLTTKRYTKAELEAIANDSAYVTLCCRLKDKFGDNGVISLLIGNQVGEELQIVLWLMSCRVLNRRIEEAMFSALVQYARSKDIKALRGYYYRTPKNGMVADLYKKLGFEAADDQGTEWYCKLTKKLFPDNLPMEISYGT